MRYNNTTDDIITYNTISYDTDIDIIVNDIVIRHIWRTLSLANWIEKQIYEYIFRLAIRAILSVDSLTLIIRRTLCLPIESEITKPPN